MVIRRQQGGMFPNIPLQPVHCSVIKVLVLYVEVNKSNTILFIVHWQRIVLVVPGICIGSLGNLKKTF